MPESFHNVLFPLAISFGATGGPERRNEIVRLTSGAEKRNARFARSRRKYDAGTGLRSIGDLYDVLAFFEARRGSLHGFRFRDPFDMKTCGPVEAQSPLDQPLGDGDGVTASFQLVKTYGEGDEAYLRPITRPAAGTVLVAIDGAVLTEGDDYTVDHETGVVTFQPDMLPPAGAAITAGFVFDVPVRFDTPQISASLATFQAGQIPSIPLIEIADE